jgi:hypothetical protein
MTWALEAAVAHGASRLQNPAPTLNGVTSTLSGSTPTLGKVTSRNPAPAVLTEFTPPAELKFTAGGAGA